MDWMQQFMTGSKGAPFGSMGGANNNPASYSGGAGKGGGNGGITPQSPNPYMPQGLGRFQGGYQVPRVANAFTNYQPQVMTGGLFSGIPQYNSNPQPVMMGAMDANPGVGNPGTNGGDGMGGPAQGGVSGGPGEGDGTSGADGGGGGGSGK